jgi:ectoine hydroxylase-related dioxygenase (phytanoyl-CoA dioxygenase family)
MKDNLAGKAENGGHPGAGGPAQLESFERDAPSEAVVAALRRDGAAIVRDQVAPDVVDAVLRELRPHFDKQGTASQNDFNGYKTLRLSCVLAESRTSAELIGHPRVLEVADAVLLRHCKSYQIGSTTAIEIWPGEGNQMLHRDDGIYPISLAGMELQVSAMWSLQDFTLENGATRVIPGSHRRVEPYRPRDSDVCQAAMTKGSLLLYLGSTLHGGGANRSNAPRAGLINTYSLGWLRPEVNHLLTLPRDLVDSYPERIRRLMGYQSYGRYLGVYPDDPDGNWQDDRVT